VGNLLIPALLGFGWLYVWREYENPFRFLTMWNAYTQAFFLFLNLVLFNQTQINLFLLLQTIITITLLIFYFTNYVATLKGSKISGLLIMINVFVSFTLILTSLDRINPIFLGRSLQGTIGTFGSFFTDIATIGILAAACPQIYWLDLLVQEREKMIVHQYYESIIKIDNEE
jgi:hypothetical protein